MKYDIVFGDLANITLEYNLAFLKAFNPVFSKNIRRKITDAINNLNTFPNAYPIYKRIDNYIYRKVIVNSTYNIIFSVKQNIVFIFYINDARRNTDIYYDVLK